MSLQDVVTSCIKNCHEASVADDDNWYKTIVLAGGCACMPGLAGNCNHIVFIIISYLLLL